MDQATLSTASANTLHCALELSKKSWLLAIQFPDREQPSLYPIAGGDAEKLMAKLTQARDRWAKTSGVLPMITLCYEVGYDAFWLARFLKARGVECLVIDPGSLQVSRRGRRVKTDRVEAAAPSVGVKVSAAPVHDVTDIERVIAVIASEGNGGLISAPDLFLVVHRDVTIELTARYRVPTIYQWRYFATDGGLISYGSDLLDQYARAAEYIDRILKGAKPTDLPVQAPIKYELVINLKTAKALGLEVPVQLQLRADEVIE
jgi:ABC transporter substrate binding protein